eukprot:PITA_33149
MVRRDTKFDEQKAMRVSLKRELKLHVEEELLVPKEEEPQTDVEQPHAEDPGVETSTHAESSRDGQKRSREANRLVMDARENVEGIDHDETFAPEARYSSIRSMLPLSAQMGWKVHQMDVKTVFLNGKIEEELIKSCKEDLAREFEMKDMGLMHYFLGMEVWQKDGEVFVSQGKYVNEILRRFHMDKCKTMQTPLACNWRKEDATSSEVVAATVYQQLVGSLMYLVNKRPDLCFAVNQLSQAMVQPTKLFWKAAKHALRYLRGTSQYGLWHRCTEGVKIQGFTDASWEGSPSDWKSTLEGIFNLGSAVVSWYSKK